MNEITEKVPTKLDTHVQQRSHDISEINIEKYNKGFLENIKTEDITDIGSEYLGQMTNFFNEVGYNDEQEEYVTKFMNYYGGMKKERSEDHEVVNTDTGENNFDCDWLEVGKAEDVKFSFTVDVPSSEVGCSSENSGHDGFSNDSGCDNEHREYSASEVIKYSSNIKEEKTDLEDAVIDSEKHRGDRSADSEYLKSVGFTCKDVGDPSQSVRWYQCHFCEYKTTRKDTPRKHFIRKHDDNPEWYQCQFCEFRTKIKDSLTRHSTRQHGLHAWYQCEFCEFRTKYKFRLKEHFTGRHDTSAEWYRCHLCEFKTKVKANLSKHFRAKHTSPTDCTSEKQNQDCDWHQCQRCPFKTKSKGSLRNHFKYKHDETAEWYQCHFCDYKTKIRASLKAHFNCRHNQDVEWYYCQKCPFKTDSKGYLQKHFKYKHDYTGEWYQCNFCDYKTKLKPSLKAHFNCKHNQDVEWYHCQKCPFKTENKRYLKKHFTYKHDDTAEWYQCRSCEFKTKYDSYLKLHSTFQHENDESSKSHC